MYRLALPAINHTKAWLFLLMPVFSQTLFTLVRSHFVFLPFLSTRHNNVLIILNRSDKNPPSLARQGLYQFFLLFQIVL